MKHLVRMMALFALVAVSAPCQKVTEEAQVRIDGRVQRVRKINGRWWSDDNRQLTPPQKGGHLWYIGSEKGKAWPFYHHRPVNLALAESLHLFMDPASVQSLLGEPNEATESRESRMWMYYAEDGTALLLRFMYEELGEARYERQDFGVAGKPVQSVAQELGGRDIFKIMADRAWQRNSPAAYAKYHDQDQGNPATKAAVVSVGGMSARADPPKRQVSGELADSIKEGMTRSDVVRILGEASGGMQISGESDFETMSYPLDRGGQISLRLEKGKVVRISR
jgi:hypothetical protein